METIQNTFIQEKALEFATKAHKNQKRKYTEEPYVNHVIAVAKTITDLGLHQDLICAALLHDTVEDTETTIEDIDREFGTSISNLVEQLTDVYTSETFPKINRTERKKLECYRLSKVSGNAKTIKLADLIDNTSSIVKYDPKFAKVYLREKEEMLQILNGGDPRLMQRALSTLKEAKKQLGI